MKNTVTQNTDIDAELARINARENVLRISLQSRQEAEQNRLQAEVAALPGRFRVASLRDVIHTIQKIGGIRLRADIDDAKRQRIVNMLKTGAYTPAQIATMENVSVPTVHSIRQDAKIKGRKRGRPAMAV